MGEMRSIIWSSEFEAQVFEAGGARLFDEALEPILDALRRNPFGFQRFENDFTSFRYARTFPIPGRLSALTVIFVIDAEKNVVLQWFEEDSPF